MGMFCHLFVGCERPLNALLVYQYVRFEMSEMDDSSISVVYTE